MKTLYFDCFAGASGNMILGALVSLGVDKNELVEQIELLGIADFSIKFSTRDKSGISAVHAEVKFQEEKTHRHLSTIVKIISDSRLSEKVKNRALKIFTRLAEAEAKVHGIEVEKVHFHEVGAMDAIIDVVGSCIGFEMLGIEKFACSKIHVGSGFVQMAHGKFPIPPPAVAELLRKFEIYSTEIEGELITPTGAAIISTVCDAYEAMPQMRLRKTAYGAGTRNYQGFPNVLRLILGEESKYSFYSPSTDNSEKDGVNSKGKEHFSNAETFLEAVAAQANYAKKLENEELKKTSNLHSEKLLLIETNVDDISPQILGFVMERSFELGALDCWFTPIQMKKNRPATMISILCENEKRETFIKLLYTETSTIGVRIKEIERDCLPREIVKIETEFGEIDVKVAKYDGKIVNAKPEYEQIRQIALKLNISMREIEKTILKKFNQR